MCIRTFTGNPFSLSVFFISLPKSGTRPSGISGNIVSLPLKNPNLFKPMQPALYLIPVLLSETEINRVLPLYNQEIIGGIRHFIVENIRTARRFLKKSNPDIPIDQLTFYELNRHTPPENIPDYLEAVKRGLPIGLLSEAGCPAIADPGADVVAIAQRKGITVIPLVGPSSILLSLMASGFNGQNFAFRGYLPIETTERARTLKTLEQHIYQQHQTQIFIETPYRNDKLVEELIRNCRPETRLCIATDLTGPEESVRTHTLQEWKRSKPALHKKTCIFLLYK